METMELVKLLDIPEVVERKLADYESSRDIIISGDLTSQTDSEMQLCWSLLLKSLLIPASTSRYRMT